MKVLSVLLAIAIALASPGCAALGGILPDVILYVEDGSAILNVIASFVDAYFLQHPDPAAQAKVDDAMTKTRSALATMLHAAQGASSLSDANVDAAFNDFKAAYMELLALTAPMGVSPTGGAIKMSAAPGKLMVPEPLAFRRGAR